MHDADTPAEPPPPVTRELLHTREIRYRGYARSDGLWDVEGTLLDTKEQAVTRPDGTPLAAGSAVHHMQVVVTVDDTLRIVAIDSTMPAAPMGECQQARAPLQRLVGQRLGRGWRKALTEAMGGTTGCTHLRELLFNLATGAFQALPAVRDQRRRERGEPPIDGDAMPHFIDGCLSWRRTGPAVQQLFPRWALVEEPPPPTSGAPG